MKIILYIIYIKLYSKTSTLLMLSLTDRDIWDAIVDLL